MAAKKSTETGTKRKRMSARDEYEAMVARKRDGAKRRREREAAEASAGARQSNEAPPEPRPDHSADPPRQVGALRRMRSRERAAQNVVIVPPPVDVSGQHFKDEKELKSAVRESLGFGHGISFLGQRDENPYSKEAAQLLNRLGDVVREVVRFIRSDDDFERRKTRDDAADFLRQWVNRLTAEDLDSIPSLHINSDLEQIIQWWNHEDNPNRATKVRDLAEIALRQGYWPVVDMKKHPTVADVIAQVSKAVRRSLLRRSGN